MAEVYTVSYDNETLKKLYNSKRESDDYIGALSVLKRMRRANPDDFSLCQEFAEVYYLLEAYDNSVEETFKYLGGLDKEVASLYKTILSDEDKLLIKTKYAKSYCALGSAYYRSGNDKVAGYYYNKQLKTVQAKFDVYYDALSDFLQEITDVRSNYYIAYPYEKADFSNLLDECEEHFRSGDYELAVEKLSVIPKTSKYYSEALLQIALCKYFLDEEDDCVKTFDKLIKLYPTNVYALCNAISINNKIGNKTKVKNYREKLDKIEITDDLELYKAIMAYSEIGDELRAEKYCRKYLKVHPYDTNVLLIGGQIKYNLSKYSEAEKYFTKAYQITGSCTARHYLTITERKISGLKAPNKFEYSFDIPDAERKKILKGITHYINSDLTNLSQEDYDLIYYIASYAFETQSYGLQSTAVTVLSSLTTKTAQQMLVSALVKPSVFDQIKAGILGFLTADGYTGIEPSEFGNVYKKIEFINTKFEGEGSQVMNEAYALCFAKVAPLEDNLDALRLTAVDMFYNYGVDFSLITDVKSLSALIFELSEIKPIKNRREYAKFFDANLKEIKRLKELFVASKKEREEKLK